MVGLGDLPGGLVYSEAYGVSGNGSVGGGVSSTAPGAEAFRWTSAGGMLGAGSLFGSANGVSADGSVIVGAGGSLSHIGSEAVRWTSAGGMVGLGVLPGGSESVALGVSTDGSVVVGYGRSENDCCRPNFEAFRWTSASGMVSLGDLPGGLFESYAVDVSGDGSVVIGYGDTDFGSEAFLWTSDGRMKRLWDVLLVQGVDPAANGWTKLEAASGISANGNTIVGWGTRNGNTEAFIAVIPTIVPEPSSLALLTIAATALLRSPRSRRQPTARVCE
jgi:probable HAF family extracellular repeat protein